MPKTRWFGPFVVAASALVYLSTACPFVLGGDNGEFATLLETGGVAHPPGFPLYVLVLRVLRWIPAGTPAHRAALITAVIAVAAVYFVDGACRAWGASHAAAGIATAAFASSSVAWKLATHAEVFAPTALVAAAVLSFSAPAREGSAPMRAALLGLLAGFGLSLHPSIVFLAPVGLLAFALAVLRSTHRLSAALFGLLGLAIGLLPYLFLYESARHADPRVAWVWGDVRDATSLFRHVRRADYGTFSLALRDSRPDPRVHVPRLLVWVTREMLGLPVAAALGGGVWMAARERRNAISRERTMAVGALALSFLLVGPGFAALFNRPLTDVGGAIVERFYLLPMVPLAVLGALALDEIAPAIMDSKVAYAIVPLVPVAGFALSADSVREESRPTVEYYVKNVLASVPENSVILGGSDHRFGGFLYASRALDLRPDVEFIAPRLLFSSWYHAEESTRLGLPLVAARGDRLDSVALVGQLLAAERPVWLAGFVAKSIETNYPTYPLGPLIRVLPRGERPPDPDSLERANALLLARFRLEPSPPASPNSWGGIVHTDYATPWLSLADAFASQGSPERAAICRHRAEVLAPWVGATRRATP